MTQYGYRNPLLLTKRFIVAFFFGSLLHRKAFTTLPGLRKPAAAPFASLAYPVKEKKQTLFRQRRRNPGNVAP